MNNDADVEGRLSQGLGHGTMQSYVIGFVWSIILTFASYLLVVGHVLTGWELVLVLVGLGCLQILIQLLCFLHLSQEAKPYPYLLFFLFTLMVVGILVGGSIWIMYHLAERTMTPMEMADIE